MIPFIGFAPDLDPATPGVITSCSQVIPTIKGMAGAPTANDVGADALAAACVGAALVTRLDNNRRVIAGTTTKLYELSGTTWTDVSRAAAYGASADYPWRFAQFGNVSLATNAADRIQYSSSGAFADISTAPKARIIETVAGFVMALGINDATVGGDRPDAWWCSNIYDYATWTPATSNQAAYGYLLDTPGEIRAGKRLGSSMVVYKENSLYLGQYIGPPVIWSWQLVASDIGALSQESVIDVGGAHLFIGRDDFWLFDGSRPRSIGAPVREWFFANSNATYRYKTQGYYDRFNARAWWFFASNSSTTLDSALVYNVKTDRWGYAQIPVASVFGYVTPDVTWDNWPPGTATDYENIADLAFDSPAWDTGQAAPAVISSTDNKIKTLAGPTASSTIVTGDFGDDVQYTTLTNVMPRYVTRPTTASLSHLTKAYQGASPVAASTVSINGNKFDTLASGRFHRVSLSTTGNFEIVGFEPKLSPDGTE